MSRLTVFLTRVAYSVPLLLTALTLGAQTTGTIQGTIRDTAGTPLPGVTVEATSPSLQGTRSVVTRGDGNYRFPAVAPGTYRVKATLPSFASAERTTTVS